MYKSNSSFLSCYIISHYINTSYVINFPIDSLDCFQFVATCKQQYIYLCVDMTEFLQGIYIEIECSDQVMECIHSKMLLDATYLLSEWQYLHFQLLRITVSFSSGPHQCFLLFNLLIFPNPMGEHSFSFFFFYGFKDHLNTPYCKLSVPIVSHFSVGLSFSYRLQEFFFFYQSDRYIIYCKYLPVNCLPLNLAYGIFCHRQNAVSIKLNKSTFYVIGYSFLFEKSFSILGYKKIFPPNCFSCLGH